MDYSGDLLLMTMFFCSSRRLHTRCYRDWSSDVCSSDLSRRLADPCGRGTGWRPRCPGVRSRRERSEERRVGKECRSRWTPNQYKKNRKYIELGWINKKKQIDKVADAQIAMLI